MITINFTGGIVSPGYLKDILEAARQARIPFVRFGLRQQMILNASRQSETMFTRSCNEKGIQLQNKPDAYPNIISSYPGTGIFNTENWLREGVYKDIFSQFLHPPRLKINIVDGNQTFTPFFTGHINWIASLSRHFWWLYIRVPGTEKIFAWPELVYSNDIGMLSRVIEEQLTVEKMRDHSGHTSKIYEKIKSSVEYTGKYADSTPEIPKFSLPYYEGFHQQHGNCWLGLYRRDEQFPVSFLSDLCDVCLQTAVGQLYTTPWKSLIIRDINPADRNMWDYILGKYRINVRHAANELNWQVDDYHEDALQLKRHVIRQFDKEDVRTFGICIAVQVHNRPNCPMYGSVILRKRQNKNPHRLKSLERFDILYRRNFNPNAGEWCIFRENVEKDHIATYLISLCKMFYEKTSSDNVLQKQLQQSQAKQKATEPEPENLYQCTHCYSVYDPSLGDPEAGIIAGTPFQELSPSYCCPLCGSPKVDLVPVEQSLLVSQRNTPDQRTGGSVLDE